MIERKIKTDGSINEFSVDVVHREPGLVVVRYVVPAAGGRGSLPVHIPGGTTSDGYFWADRPYNVYRMRAPDGSLLVHRFDALTDVTITDDVVSYRDLTCDWWLLPDGTLIEEDIDDFEGAAAVGEMDAADVAAARRAIELIRGHSAEILDELAAIERRFSTRSGVPGAT
jgi:hypothetical protein